MNIDILKQILQDLQRTQHRGLESNFPCDLMKIGSPGRPYRGCTCGLDKRIEAVEEEIKSKEPSSTSPD